MLPKDRECVECNGKILSKMILLSLYYISMDMDISMDKKHELLAYIMVNYFGVP